MRALRPRPAHGIALACSLVFLAGHPESAPAQTPDLQAASNPREVLVEVRVHGNHTTPDAEVLQLAGLQLGRPLTSDEAAQVETRLKASGKFDDVVVRKRFRSIDDPTQVVLIIIVREHPVPDIGPPALRPIRKVTGNLMYLPVIDFTDGYGLTYGVRASLVDTPARKGRLSMPLTWGGTRRAALELDQPLGGSGRTRLVGAAALWQRENPHYRLDDNRREAWVGLAQALGPGLRGSVRGGFTRVTFGPLVERFSSLGADVTADTRRDPIFPRNAVTATLGWDAIDPERGRAVNRYRAEAHGYLGLVGQAVLSVRGLVARADGVLPLYERYLMGGASSLRGYRAGTYSGDAVMEATAEVRAPVSSPLGVGRSGFSVFADAGKVREFGGRFADAQTRIGGGVGWFVLASVFQLNVDVAWREGGGGRVHVTSGFQF